MTYPELGKSIGEMLEKKQKAYGDSFGRSQQILKVLYPNGIEPDQYQDSLTITRIIDKLFRIANQKDAFGESPYQDIAGYAILAEKRNRELINFDSTGEKVSYILE